MGSPAGNSVEFEKHISINETIPAHRSKERKYSSLLLLLFYFYYFSTAPNSQDVTNMKGEPRDKKREGVRERESSFESKQKVLADVLPNAGERNFSRQTEGVPECSCTAEGGQTHTVSAGAGQTKG